MKKALLFVLFLLLTLEANAQFKVYFGCTGGEKGKVLSHANGNVSLQKGYQGDGEAFVIRMVSSKGGLKKFSLECCGKEKGRFLSHANGRVFLQRGCLGDGELWVMFGKEGYSDAHEIIQACGGETGYCLSHANGRVCLMPGYGGEGELWLFQVPD